MRPTRQVLALAVLCAMSLQAGVARAAAYVVSTTADSGTGSLREAVTNANAASDADTISFAIGSAGSPATITLTSLLPNVAFPVTIDGTTSPAGRVVVTGSAVTNGFTITGGAVTIRGLVVNGFTSAQIRVNGGAGGHVFEGNYIGPNAAGTASASPSSSTGIWITSAGGSRIGGWTAAERNVISGNGTGIFFEGTYATPNVVVGNYIGTTASGLAALKNTGAGIEDFLGSPNTIGGTAAGAGNVISGNGSDGIALGLSGSAGYVVQGNLIGVGADDVTPVGNGRHGVRFLSNMTNALIGGPAPNHIAHNASAGVLIALTADGGNAVLGNSIHDNGALGIDINGSGVNANDAGDGDTGSNDGQNFPVLDSLFAGGDQIGVTLESTPNTTFTIELFANAACDSTGHGEAEELVGSYLVATDGTGHVAFTATMTRTIAPGEWVTATATDPAGSTSELSRCAPEPFPTTTTSTSTTSSTSSSTTSTTATTSSSSTAPTTSSTSTTAEPTTSSTSTTVATTSSSTSSTLAEPSTTTTSTLPADTTTSTSSLPGETTTTSTLPEEPTTSTTAGPTTTSTSSSTVADATTSSTSTTDVPGTSSTSSSTVPGETTTSTSTPPEETTTSTSTPPAETTTSTTLAEPQTTTSSSSSTSTTSVDPSTTSTTAPAGGTSTSSSTTLPGATTSTTTTTVRAASTTSTTLAEPACGREVAFAPLRCRLDGLATVIGGAPELVPMRGRLDKQLARARRTFDAAEARCQGAERGPAKRKLRMVRKRLKAIGKAMLAKSVRRTVPPAVADPIARAAAALGTDVRALATSILCRS